MQIFDYILVGQGISGTILGYELRKAGYSVKQFDVIAKDTPSRVAAGIWHPMVFKRFTKGWMADEFIAAAEVSYAEMQTTTSSHFFHPKPYARLLGDIEERNNWDIKSAEPMLQTYMQESRSNKNSSIKADIIGPVKHAGFLDTELFLSEMRTYFGNTLVDGEFYPEFVTHDDSGVTYMPNEGEAMRANRLVFADGPRALKSSYFDWVPFQPVKGEVITIYSAGLRSEAILSKGVFICPIGGNLYNVGATYDWRELNTEPTEEGLSSLKEKLDTMLHVSYEVVAHRAGIRPAVRGRRPLLGNHPEYKNIWLFNGMGSKAVLMAPYWAKHIMKHWHQEEPISEEVNLKRFYSFYNPES
jgi:glycine/D-amino acid oxidase-like deaminating enzyme